MKPCLVDHMLSKHQSLSSSACNSPPALLPSAQVSRLDYHWPRLTSHFLLLLRLRFLPVAVFTGVANICSWTLASFLW